MSELDRTGSCRLTRLTTTDIVKELLRLGYPESVQLISRLCVRGTEQLGTGVLSIKRLHTGETTLRLNRVTVLKTGEVMSHVNIPLSPISKSTQSNVCISPIVTFCCICIGVRGRSS